MDYPLNVSQNVTQCIANQELQNKFIIPNQVGIFAALAVIFMVVGLVIVKKDREKFLMIWFTSVIIGLVFLFTLLYVPSVANIIPSFLNRAT